MYIDHHHLRMHRKRSPLRQADLAFLLKQPNDSTISRCEKGERKPTIEMLLLYQLLFSISLEEIFQRHLRELSDSIKARIPFRIEELKSLPQDYKLSNRIAFLEATLIKLTN